MKGNKGTYLLLAALFFCSSLALYEDEIGLNDWYIQGLGRINHIGFGLQGQKNRIIVSTEENVIASLKLNSDLEWRQPLSEKITDLQVHPGVIVATTDKSTFAFNYEGSFLWRESESVLDSAALALKVEGTFAALVTEHHVKILGADGSLVWESKQVSAKLSAVSARHDARQFVVLGQGAKGPVVLEIKVEDKKAITMHTIDLTNGPTEAIKSVVQTEDYTFFTTSRTDAVYWFKKGTTGVTSHNVKRVDQLRDIELSNGVAVVSQDSVSVLQVKGDALTSVHDFQKSVTVSNAVTSGDSKYITAHDGDSLIVVQLSSTVQVNKHPHKSETGAAIQHLALTAQAGSVPLLILSAADGTAHALELDAKQPSPRWSLNTPAAVKSARIVDCAPRPRDTATQSLLDLSAIQQYLDLNAIQKTIMDLIQPSTARRERVPEREEDLLVKDEFGFKKVIIAITEYSSIYAIHSSGGRVLWRQYVPDVELQQVYIIKKAIHYPPEIVIVGTNTKTARGFLRHMNPHTGQVIRDVQLTYELDQVVQLPFHDKEYRSVLLLVDNKKNVNIYPDNEETRTLVHENREHIFFYQVDEKAGSVTGYTVPSTQGETAAVPVWQKLFGAHRHVAVAHNQVNIYQSARPGSILTQKYFYLNPNLLALAVVDTEESEGEEELDLLLIDTVTGQLLHQVHHNSAQGPVNIVAKDYWVAYQYWNSKTQQHEISVIEMYYNDDRAQRTFSSYDHEDVYPDTFESQSYINPRGVRVMQPTATHYGISNTHVLLGLENGQIYSLDKRFLDSRRVPPNEMKQEDKDRGILPYMPILPYNPRQYVSYSRTVQNLSGIVTYPTLLESTSVMLAYGTDLFFVPVAPSRTYDRLSPDFSYGVLIGVVAIIVVLTFFVKGVAKKRELNKKWQ